MPVVEGKVEVNCSLERAWDLFTRFDDVARLIPSVDGVEVQGDRVLAKVCVKLGALPITSRVVLEVTERKPMACLKAIGISYLGETVVEQLAKKPLKEITSDSAGKLDLHLDLRPGESAEQIVVLYTATVEAEGRLRKIYDSILKTKAPAMMQEFAENIRTALEAAESKVEEPPQPPLQAASASERTETPPVEQLTVVAPTREEPPAPPAAGVLVVRRGLWSRFFDAVIAWFRRLFGGKS